MIHPVIFNDEIFKDINIEGIAPIYSISNYGTVINKLTGRQLSASITDDGYARIGLRTINGGSNQFLIHRIVMMTFHPVANQNELEVNHLYGVKLDNRDTQLEWTTTLENSHHAFNTGLNNNIRENHAKALLTNDQVHLICKGLSEGKSFNEIKIDIGETPVKDIDRAIRCIKDRKAWTSISKDYIFKEYPNKRNLFTDDEVVIICKLLESGTGFRDILIQLGFDINAMSTTDLQNMCDIIGDIRNGNRYKHISKNFNISYSKIMRYDQKFNYDQIHFICKCLEDGIKTSEILNKLGIFKDIMSEKEYDGYRHFISRVKTRKIFTNISNNYNF